MDTVDDDNNCEASPANQLPVLAKLSCDLAVDFQKRENYVSATNATADTTNIQTKKGRIHSKPHSARRHSGAQNKDRGKRMCKWLIETFPFILEEAACSTDDFTDGDTTQKEKSSSCFFEARHVLDVGGGKGELSSRLAICHRLNVVMIDPRPADIQNCFDTLVLPKLPKKHQQRYNEKARNNLDFRETILRQRFRQLVTTMDDHNLQESKEIQAAVAHASILLGLHADGATEAIVDAALKYRKPFVVVPCCVFPTLFSQRRVLDESSGKMVPVRSHDQFCRYLMQKDPHFVMETLPFAGRNTAIWWDGKP